LQGNFRSHLSRVSLAGNSLIGTVLQSLKSPANRPLHSGPCKTRPSSWRRGFLVASLSLVGAAPLAAQQSEANEAWTQGRYDAARAGYQRVLAQNPRDVRANLRIGVLLSWQGKLDSALIYLARARAAAPVDPEIRLIQARVMAWDKQFDRALLLYDSLLSQDRGLREAALGRARTLAWGGRLEESRSAYRKMIAMDSTDREAMLGEAQVSAWKGDLAVAEREYRELLSHHPRDVDARVGLGYVYLWQGREAAAGRQAGYALAIDSTHKGARELRQVAREATRAAVESSANWSNDSDDNTSFWQTLGGTASVGGGVGLFGSVNALETSDPLRDATRVGGEAGVSLTAGRLQLSGAAGARRLIPDVAPPRTAATYRARVTYRPVSRLGLNLGYSRLPFDEIAALMERELDMELLEGGVDIKPSSRLTLYGGGGVLWLSDGNSRTSFSGGLNQKIGRPFFVGLFGRTLSYDQRGIGYFSPDRFFVLEGVAGYAHESRRWLASLSGGLGAQQVGERGVAQTEWHVGGRIGPRWGSGNRIELFGLITNSAVSSTSGAFRYRAAGVTVRLGL
jgi:tetratricopeptide (TPR) repeat protein